MCFINSEELQFFKSVVSIPMVNTTLHLGLHIYGNIKRWNSNLDRTLTATEQLAKYIANTPTLISVAQKMETPILFVDRLASDGLQMLENKYPSIRMTPGDLKEETHKRLLVIRSAGSKKLEELMIFLCRHPKQKLERAFLLLESKLIPKISIYMDILEKTSDNDLPLTETEPNDTEMAEKQRVFARLSFIPNSVRGIPAQRYNQLVLKITWTEH